MIFSHVLVYVSIFFPSPLLYPPLVSPYSNRQWNCVSFALPMTYIPLQLAIGEVVDCTTKSAQHNYFRTIGKYKYFIISPIYVVARERESETYALTWLVHNSCYCMRRGRSCPNVNANYAIARAERELSYSKKT